MARVAAAKTSVSRAAAGAWSLRVQRALPVLALLGLIAIVVAGGRRADVPPLSIGRVEAEAAADAALAARGVHLSPDWRHYATTRTAPEDPGQWLGHVFVWREAGQAAYRKLVGNWLAPPFWEVRYARFDEGDVVDRAEEWRVVVDNEGKARSLRHLLPEQRAGAKLSRDDARTLAHRELRQMFGLDPGALREVEAREDAQPARTDWSFTFADPRVEVGKGGEARAVIVVAGDEVSGSGRYVFVPEDWQRGERERSSRLNVAKIGVVLLFSLVGLGAIIWASVAWTRDHFDRRVFWVVTIVSLAATIVGSVDQWPSIAFGLSTTEPVLRQVALASARALFGAVLGALLAGMLSGVAAYAARMHVTPGADTATLWLRGVYIALFAIGVDALVATATPDLAPTWPGYGAENAVIPWLARAASALKVLTPMAGAIVAFRWLDRLSHGWTRHRLLCVLLLALAEGAVAALSATQWIDIVAAAIIGAAVSAFLFAFVVRFDLRVVPAAIAVYAVVAAVADAMQKTTTQGWILASVGIAVTLAISWIATRYLVARGELPQPAPEPAAAQ